MGPPAGFPKVGKSENASIFGNDTHTDGYEDLRAILDEAYAQSSQGKGKERHANNLPWDKQPILQITRNVGLGYPTGQAAKKIYESCGMVKREKREAAVQELLGAIVYAAAAIRYIRESEG